MSWPKRQCIYFRNTHTHTHTHTLPLNRNKPGCLKITCCDIKECPLGTKLFPLKTWKGKFSLSHPARFPIPQVSASESTLPAVRISATSSVSHRLHWTWIGPEEAEKEPLWTFFFPFTHHKNQQQLLTVKAQLQVGNWYVREAADVSMCTQICLPVAQQPLGKLFWKDLNACDSS